MTIYIESFIIQNILINFCLLRLTYLTIKQKTSFFKMLLASIIGASFSVIAAVFLKDIVIMNIIKFLSAFLMILIAFKQTKKQFIFSYIMLFIFTYAMGGAITSLSGASYQTSFGVIISSKISLEAVSLFVIILTYIFELAVKHIKFKLKLNNLIYPITLCLNNNKIRINGFLDTGNLLKYNGEPVVIIDLSAYLKLTHENYINFLIKKSETATLNTVNGKNQIKIFKLDYIEIKINNKKKIIKDQYVAVNAGNSFKNTNYQALLTPGLI